MAETTEDKEKAEKVAAARKRYEQLKKQKAKKGGASAATKKAKEEDSKEEEETVEDAAAKEEPEDVAEATTVAGETGRPDEGTIKLEEGAGEASEKVQEIYRKQAAKIEQLDKDNRKLEAAAADREKKLKKLESEAEELRDIQGGMAELKNRAAQAESSAKEVERLKNELSALQRQQSYATRRKSLTSIPKDAASEGGSKAEIAAKTSTIESLELEVSNLRHSLSISESQQAELNSRISGLETQLQMAEQAKADAKQELENLRQAQRPVSATSNDNEQQTDPAARVKELKMALASAQKSAAEATTRSAQLDKKIEALTSLHRDSETRNQTQTAARSKELERLRNEANEMRKKLGSVSNENARLREVRARRSSSLTSNPVGSSSVGVDDEGDAHGDEKRKLQSRIRELEGQVFDLKRGVWRERRKELQGGAEGAGGEEEDEEFGAGTGVFDDIDLNAPTSATHGHGHGGSGGITSPYGAFSSMLNAFTGASSSSGGGVAAGASHRPSGSQQQQQQQRKASLNGGFLGGVDDDDDFEFDEEAFKAAQHEQEMKRLERIKEVKRGLKQYVGFRVDLVDLRGGAMAGVFDV